jgi:ribosomal protein S24E
MSSRSLMKVVRTGLDRLLQAALEYARKGWSVVPMYEPDGAGGCSCGRLDCTSPAKHPRTTNGLHDASRDEERIRSWWERWPNANVGVATGVTSGIFVVDLDGWASCMRLLKLEQTYTQLPETLRSATSRSKGFHLFFRYPTDAAIPNSAGRIDKGIDVRGEGGVVVVPPSIGVTGVEYSWVNTEPICEADPWLLTLARGRVQNSTVMSVSTRATVFTTGTRNQSLASLAGWLRRKGFGRETIDQALKAINRTACIPPLDQREVERIAGSIASYRPSGGPTPVLPKELRFYTGREIADMISGEIEWIAKPWIALGSITVLDGKVKAAGKTTWLTHLSRAVLDGAEFMGEKTQKSRIVYLTEQPGSSFREALRRADLLDREDFVALFIHDTLGVPWAEVAKRTIEKARDLQASLVIVDTLPRWARMPGETENSAGDAVLAIEPLKQAVSEYPLAVAFARHERKAGGEVGDSGRGSSALGGDVDVILALRRAGGAHPSTVRQLLARSRYDETPESSLIELTDVGYVSLGSSQTFERESVEEAILEMLPADTTTGTTIKAIIDETGASRSTVQRVLAELEQSGEVCSQPGAGRNPTLYWLAGQDDDVLPEGDEELLADTSDDNEG